MKIKLLILLFIAACTQGYAQGKMQNSTDTQAFTLIQALEFAIANNTDVKNAYADIAIADQTVKEVKSIGIPQLRGQVQFQDALQKQVFIFPNPVTGVPAPIRIGKLICPGLR